MKKYQDIVGWAAIVLWALTFGCFLFIRDIEHLELALVSFVLFVAAVITTIVGWFIGS